MTLDATQVAVCVRGLGAAQSSGGSVLAKHVPAEGYLRQSSPGKVTGKTRASSEARPWRMTVGCTKKMSTRQISGLAVIGKTPKRILDGKGEDWPVERSYKHWGRVKCS